MRESLDALELNYRLIELEGEIPYFRYSLSDVLHYGLKESAGDIVIYTTCDVLISPKLLVGIYNAMRSNAVVIPHQYPEMPFGVHEEEFENFLLEDPANTGIDIFAFSSESANRFLEENYFKKNRFLGWGMFDHLIIAGCIQLGFPIVKISAVDSTIKFHNDRDQNNESSAWMKKCHEYNVIQFRKYIKGDLRLVRLLSLRALHQAVEQNGIKLVQLVNRNGFSLIGSQLKFLIKNFR